MKSALAQSMFTAAALSVLSAVSAVAGEVSKAVDLCITQRLSFDAFDAAAENIGLAKLGGEDAKAAYIVAADMLFAYRVADLPANAARMQSDLLSLRAEVHGAAANYSMQLAAQGLNAVYRISADTILIARGTPASGVMSCKIYADSDLPQTTSQHLGPRTILTKSRAPWIALSELPLNGRHKNGQVKSVTSPNQEMFTAAVGQPLLFKHLLAIDTPSR